MRVPEDVTAPRDITRDASSVNTPQKLRGHVNTPQKIRGHELGTQQLTIKNGSSRSLLTPYTPST